MKIKNFNNYITEKSGTDYLYKLHYKQNGDSLSKGANDIDELKKFADTENLIEYEIFKNDPNFESTTQREFLIGWYDENGGGYWSNRSKAEPIILRKKITKSQ
jgi:hypothetical protein